MTNDLWRRFKGDFNSLEDCEVTTELNKSLDIIATEEEWVEAVHSWYAAGKPRDTQDD